MTSRDWHRRDRIHSSLNHRHGLYKIYHMNWMIAPFKFSKGWLENTFVTLVQYPCTENKLTEAREAHRIRIHTSH